MLREKWKCFNNCSGFKAQLDPQVSQKNWKCSFSSLKLLTFMGQMNDNAKSTS